MTQTEDLDRRAFFGKAAGATGLLILKPHLVRAYQANSAVRIGLLGCGKRGTSVATSFAKNTSARVVALADIFEDQLTQAKVTFDGLAGTLGYPGIDNRLLFKGSDAYRKLAESKEVDAIQISTPCYFHVEHLAAAVAANKHVYCEKPVGVDVVQAKRALEIGKRADGKVSLEVGFQIRKAPPFVALVQRIHEGAIGKLIAIEAHYYAPASQYPDRAASMSADELRLRNWNWDLALSGDSILEQDIHVVDICNWVTQAHPLKAYATGGRSVISHFGDTWDNYQVNYTYPDDVHVSLTTKQYGTNNYFDVSERILGSMGFSESPYSGALKIVGENPWEWKGESDNQEAKSSGFAANGAFSDNLAQADAEKEKSFVESIVSGKFHSQAVVGVESALSAMLARMAAHGGRPVAWDEMLASNQQYKLGLNMSQFN